MGLQQSASLVQPPPAPVHLRAGGGQAQASASRSQPAAVCCLSTSLEGTQNLQSLVLLHERRRGRPAGTMHGLQAQAAQKHSGIASHVHHSREAGRGCVGEGRGCPCGGAHSVGHAGLEAPSLAAQQEFVAVRLLDLDHILLGEGRREEGGDLGRWHGASIDAAG